MAVELKAGVLIGGRYRLERFLGAGGMGSVWAATHQVTGRRHALKFLRDESIAKAEMRQRFSREARAACSVDHPNVVAISDVFDSDDGTAVMVMDLLEGETLRERLERERKLSLASAADVLLPVVSAVAAAHRRGIVHRDLKPDNIYIVDGGGPSAVRVLDFGVAKLLDSHQENGPLTRTGTLLGTPCYMSPEQGFGEKDIDQRSDIWSLGVILYEMLSGVRPVEGEGVGQVLKRLTEDGITPIDAMVELPDDVCHLIGRMLERDRAARISDLREVFDVLEKYAAVKVPIVSPVSPQAVRHDVLPGAVVDGHSGQDGSLPLTRTALLRRGVVPLLIVIATIAGVAILSLRRATLEERSDNLEVRKEPRTLPAASAPIATTPPPVPPVTAIDGDVHARSASPLLATSSEGKRASFANAKTRTQGSPNSAPLVEATSSADRPSAPVLSSDTAGTVDKRRGLIEHPPF